jgi:putative transposase
MEQIEPKHTDHPPDAPQKKSSGKRGRPKGRKNRHRRDVVLTPYLRFVQETLNSLLKLIVDHVKVLYFVYDGAFGHHDALQRVKQLGLHLISKLRYDSALYFPYHGPYAGRGQRKKYGKKLNYRHLPDTAFKASFVEEDIETRIYQMDITPCGRTLGISTLASGAGSLGA